MTPEFRDDAAQQLLRELAPQVLGVVARRCGDFAAAEDAVQEALIAASTQWPHAGIPTNPRGWLYQVAMRRLTDYVRSEQSRRRREDAVATQMAADEPFVPPSDESLDVDRDDTLILLFMCCHPALTSPSAIALTLRAVGGLTTAEIANAFFVPETTMAQRISRAKQTIKSSNVDFTLPTAAERVQRLPNVLHVLYLIFSEGYTSSVGDSLHRTDLSNEAIRLTRGVFGLLPKEPEVGGLLALMLLTDARRTARTGPHGELIPLDEQDRRLWDQGLIGEGVAIISAILSSGALARGAIGAYQLQAAIAAIHDEAARVEDTDWPQILAFYGLLKQLSENPMVTLNHAIAVSMVEGPAAGLALMEKLDTDARLRGHYRLDAVRGHLHERLGDFTRARSHYLAAAERTTSQPERDYLMTKASRLADRQVV